MVGSVVVEPAQGRKDTIASHNDERSPLSPNTGD